MARFDLVIFDCDGVVVDSERIVHDVFGEFIRSLGADLDATRMNALFLGRRLADCVAIVEQSRAGPCHATRSTAIEPNAIASCGNRSAPWKGCARCSRR